MVTGGMSVGGFCMYSRNVPRNVAMDKSPHADARGPDGGPRLGPTHSARASPLGRHSSHP